MCVLNLFAIFHNHFGWLQHSMWLQGGTLAFSICRKKNKQQMQSTQIKRPPHTVKVAQSGKWLNIYWWILVSVRFIKIYWKDMLCKLCARLWQLDGGVAVTARDFGISICVGVRELFADIDGHSARTFALPLFCRTISHWHFRLANCNDLYVSTMFVLHFYNFMHSI